MSRTPRAWPIAKPSGDGPSSCFRGARKRAAGFGRLMVAEYELNEDWRATGGYRLVPDLQGWRRLDALGGEEAMRGRSWRITVVWSLLWGWAMLVGQAFGRRLHQGCLVEKVQMIESLIGGLVSTLCSIQPRLRTRKAGVGICRSQAASHDNLGGDWTS